MFPYLDCGLSFHVCGENIFSASPKFGYMCSHFPLSQDTFKFPFDFLWFHSTVVQNHAWKDLELLKFVRTCFGISHMIYPEKCSMGT